VRHGNLIEVQTGLLGVDEACSGIRSLQAILPVALFLGEIHRQSWPRRIALVLCGALVAFLCNVGRTFALSAIAAKAGTDAMANWHDPLGFAVLAIGLLAYWGFVRAGLGPPPRLTPSQTTAANVLPQEVTIGFGAYILLTVLSTEIWYRSHESDGKPQWSVAWPTYKKDFSNIALSERELDALACNERQSAEWTNSDGSHWTAYFFRWDKGPSKSRILARMHRPENCLPAAGCKLLADRGNLIIKVQSLAIPFHALDFEYQGEQLHVFFCLWEDGLKPSEQPRIRDTWDPVAKLESVVFGKRNLGQQVLEIAISGYGSSEEAATAVRRELASMIHDHA
jgi:exosortase/archaeosortase family protein